MSISKSMKSLSVCVIVTKSTMRASGLIMSIMRHNNVSNNVYNVQIITHLMESPK